MARPPLQLDQDRHHRHRVVMLLVEATQTPLLVELVVLELQVVQTCHLLEL